MVQPLQPPVTPPRTPWSDPAQPPAQATPPQGPSPTMPVNTPTPTVPTLVIQRSGDQYSHTQQVSPFFVSENGYKMRVNLPE